MIYHHTDRAMAGIETAADGEFGFHGFVEQQHGISDASILE